VSKGLTSQPIAFVAVIKLKPGADVNKFVATREAVAKKAKETYKDVNVAYIKVGVRVGVRGVRVIACVHVGLGAGLGGAVVEGGGQLCQDCQHGLC
jgi:hypothetical protein